MLLLSGSHCGGKCKWHEVVVDKHTQLRWLSVVIRYSQHRHIWVQEVMYMQLEGVINVVNVLLSNILYCVL